MKVFDRIKVAATVEGSTDPILLGAPLPGFLTAVQAGVVDGDEMPYLIVGGTQWETGVGFYSSGSITRSQIHSSSNNNLAVNFVAGPKIFMCSATAGYMNYLSNRITTQAVTLDDKVTKSGDSMTGFLTLHANPETAMHASTKNYVDGAIIAAIGGSSGPLTGITRVVTNHIATEGQQTFAVTGGFLSIDMVDVFVNGVRQPESEIGMGNFLEGAFAEVVLYAGTIEGDIVNIIVTKPIAEDAIVRKDGDVMTGFLTLHADPTSDMHAATRQYVLDSAAAAVAKPTWSVVATNTTAVAGQNLIVDLNGGSVTVTLPATPAAGDKVQIKWARGTPTNTLTIARNGSNIIGNAVNYQPVEEDGSIEMVYANAAIGWTI